MLKEIMDTDIDFAPREWARKVCGKTSLNILGIVTGQTGTGKSYNTFSAAERTAYHMSKALNRPIEEIWNFDENVGCMTWDGEHGLQKVMEKIDSTDHNVFVLDDFGTAYKTL